MVRHSDVYIAHPYRVISNALHYFVGLDSDSKLQSTFILFPSEETKNASTDTTEAKDAVAAVKKAAQDGALWSQPPTFRGGILSHHHQPGSGKEIATAGVAATFGRFPAPPGGLDALVAAYVAPGGPFHYLTTRAGSSLLQYSCVVDKEHNELVTFLLWSDREAADKATSGAEWDAARGTTRSKLAGPPVTHWVTKKVMRVSE